MSGSCMLTPKEKPFGTWKCKQLGCKELQKDPEWPSSPMRCTILNTIPGNCHCCVKELDAEPFIRVARGMLFQGLTSVNGPAPGIRNCPEVCPYKLVKKKDNGKGKLISSARCAFHGDDLKAWPLCPCNVLGNPEQEKQIELLKEIIGYRLGKDWVCDGGPCPDGVTRTSPGDAACPVIRVRFDDLKECPLWRIPAKMLPVLGPEVEKKVLISTLEKPQTDTKGESAFRKPVIKEKKKEPEDPICEACRKRFKAPLPDYACAWCKEEQEKHGRRAWTSKLNLQVLYLGDMKKLGEEIPDNSVDLIFTDPPYLKELWEEAYDNLGDLAARVLKPSGFLFTYAPHHHLPAIMDLLEYSGDRIHELSYFWIMASLNEGRTAKNHSRNVINLYKPILVYQKAPEKGADRCFVDVIKGRRQKAFHPWQQSVHDVLGVISRVGKAGDILLDPFAGTGTTLIAANLLGMDWIGFEIDPEMHAIAIRELQQTPVDLFSFGITGAACSPSREPVKPPTDSTRQAPVVIKPKKKSGGKKCEELDDIGGCMIKGDCAREELGRIKVGCHVEKSKKKGVKP